MNSDKIEPNLLISKSVLKEWEETKYQNGLQGFPSVSNFRLSEQIELVNYFKKSIKAEDRIYYLGWFLVAEASPLVDKVFYSIDRYFTIGQQNPENGKSYLIFGPYQKGTQALVPEEYVSQKILTLCHQVVFSNPSYTLCALKSNVIYSNEAYQ